MGTRPRSLQTEAAAKPYHPNNHLNRRSTTPGCCCGLYVYLPVELGAGAGAGELEAARIFCSTCAFGDGVWERPDAGGDTVGARRVEGAGAAPETPLILSSVC